MKKTIALIAVVVVTMACGLTILKLRAADGSTFQKYEYVTIRWAGRDNTHLSRSNGKVEFLGPLVNRVARPDRTDDRAFYMNIAMNSVAGEGYEFVGMTTDEIVMRRAMRE